MSKDFDLEVEINELNCPEMFKKGLKYYIIRNKLKIKSKKDLTKVVNDYKGLKLGE